MKKRICVVCFTDPSSDPRVWRQVKALTQAGHAVSTIGANSLPKKRMYRYLKAFFLLVRSYETLYWRLPAVKRWQKILPKSNFDLIIANDLETLPVVYENKNSARVLFDAHEYYPSEYNNITWSFFWRGYTQYFCKKYIPKVDEMTTVNEAIANLYHKNFGRLPNIIYNTPSFENFTPSVPQKNKIRMIHHGIAAPDRKLETMIEMMSYTDSRFTLDFMLVYECDDYFKFLKKKAADNINIRFIPAVPMLEIVKAIQPYDIGLFLLQPTCINYLNALPNKFFEFIQGRLAIAIGPSPEMAKLTKQYYCGVVSETFSPKDLAIKLNTITHEELVNFKARSDIAANELCEEKSRKTLLELVS